MAMQSVGPLSKALRRAKRRVSETLKGPEIAPWPAGPHPGLELIFWRPERGNNFGDELSRVVVQLMLARRGVTPEDQMSQPRRMLAIGSILHQARDDTVIWGTGRNGVIPDRAHFFDRLDVRAVRGPKTAEFLRERGIVAPEVYGDPALLLPKLLKDRFPKGRKGGPVFVPNLNDFRAGADFRGLAVPLLDPRQAWNVVVPAILEHDFVAASSLHGLVVAEAFGIPARYVRLTEEESTFKYADYYAGTGRSAFEAARSVPEAIEMGGEAPPVYDAAALERAFPYDLWGL